MGKKAKVIISDLENPKAKDFFVGLNGRTFLGQLNTPIEIDEDVLNILKETVYRVPNVDNNGNIIGWLNKKRYSVETVTDKKKK